ncbi:M23 family metallopeptidase [Candidatus Daviesbacteria bacterium]|nr:M23 family metallopeptidase [Candidatus Daviesbacteria bacterium]
MGNPDYFGPPLPDWTNFIVDYIRVKDIPPQPFLELPWDYQSSGLTFTDAALSINSFFDHEYPLLSSGLGEPSGSSNSVISYLGPPRSTDDYSSHDGYDYGKPAKVTLETPVLAAADGKASFTNSCGACGNTILIDHGNGFQTRYYHLLAKELIISDPNDNVDVKAGEQIGLTGSTGKSTGAHIHFMVVYDKDGDGDFENNLPDGVIDPFGWQSSELDPWENYTFSYGGKNRSGSKSYYLWKKQIDNLNSKLTSNGGVFNLEKFNLNFPSGATNDDLDIKLESAPTTKTSNNLISIGTSLFASALNGFGNIVDQFNSIYTLTVNFNNQDISNIDPNTISIYSSPDGKNWVKEQTTVNLNNKTAVANLNHFSYFALLAERIDTEAPTTTAKLKGEKGQENWFRSDVEVLLESNDSGLGVDYTLFKVEGGDWERYSPPLVFSNEGNHRVEFYSVDNDENLEEVKTIEFNIDKTQPEASLDANPKILWPPSGEMADINITGSSNDQHFDSTTLEIDDEYHEFDSTKIVATNFQDIIQLPAKRKGGDKDGRVYIIRLIARDLAGNENIEEIPIIVPHDHTE